MPVNAAGGLFFSEYIGGSQLGAATVFGRIASRHIAKVCKKEQKGLTKPEENEYEKESLGVPFAGSSLCVCDERCS
jgi:succinate dehydrogenase/fumarate reductase flavoprotein subunit